jgi:sugar phosphate isomerase/epimerase
MRLSVQLYTLRDALSSDVPGTLQRVSDIGYEYVELAGFYGHSASTWKTLLDGLGLRASGAHIPIEALEGDVDQSIADARTLDMEYVIVPYIGQERRGDYERLGRELEAIGRRVADAGLHLLYHNHDFEFQNDGLSKMYAAADPSLVKAELDLAWVKIAGYEPAEVLRAMGDRVQVVHLKDYDPAVDPQWKPAGRGVVDWDAVLAECGSVRYGVVELDAYAGNPMDAVRNSYEYFAARGLR